MDERWDPSGHALVAFCKRTFSYLTLDGICAAREKSQWQDAGFSGALLGVFVATTKPWAIPLSFFWLHFRARKDPKVFGQVAGNAVPQTMKPSVSSFTDGYQTQP